MTPYQLALLAAESSPFVDTLQDDLQAHLHNGVVISSPDYFAMFRPVWSHWPEDILLTPAVVDPEGDAWFVWACAGDWRKAIEDGRETAGHKDMLLFHRRGKLRYLSLSPAR